jgi:hypothetical protein
VADVSDDFTIDDIRQMRKEGDLRSFIRGLSRETQQPAADREFPAAAPPLSRADGRPVGSWPLGAGRPGDPIPYLPADSELSTPPEPFEGAQP